MGKGNALPTFIFHLSSLIFSPYFPTMKEHLFSDKAFYKKLIHLTLPIAFQSLMLASVAGRRIMPEPIMLIAVTVVSCTTPIFLLLDNVVPFFLKTYRIIRRWGKSCPGKNPEG